MKKEMKKLIKKAIKKAINKTIDEYSLLDRYTENLIDSIMLELKKCFEWDGGQGYHTCDYILFNELMRKIRK